MEEARKYLEAVVDWNEKEYIGLHWTKHVPGYEKPVWYSRPVQSVDAALRQLKYIRSRTDFRDVYVALGTQKTFGFKTSKTGQQYPIAIRGTDNVGHHKSFYIDIDVKGKAYPSQADALAALKKFITDAGLPPVTTVVSSGSGGLHVYWSVVDHIEPDIWQKYANALVEAIMQHGLIADTLITVDSARVLRVPDTLNYKVDPPGPVQLLVGPRAPLNNDDFYAALEPFVVEVAPRAASNDNKSGERFEMDPRDIRQVADACPFIKDTLANHGVDTTHIQRLDLYLLSTFCKDTDTVAWDLVKCRSTLKEGEFDELLQLMKDRREERGFGPPKCSTLRRHDVKQCLTCPKYNEGRTPLTVSGAYNFLPSNMVLPWWLPDGASIDFNGVVSCAVVVDKKKGMTEHRPVFPNPIMNPWFAPLNGVWTLQFSTIVGGDRVEQVSIPAEETATKDAITKALRRHMIFARIDEDRFEFMVSFLQKLQSAREGIVDKEPFGWQIDGGFTFFGKHYQPTGDAVSPFPEPALFKQYKPTGELAIWTETAKLITSQKRHSMDVILATAFAAPLVGLLGDIDGVVIGAVSNASGIGKSTTLKVGAAAWGHPVDSQCGLSDTANSVFGKAGRIRHLPLYWDELKTQAQTANFVNIIFQLTGGREKARMKKDTTLRDQKTWSTILTYCSNSSLYDVVEAQTAATTAGHLRIFEFQAEDISEAQKLPLLGAMVGKLKDNYATAGREYAEYLGENESEIRDIIQAEREIWTKEQLANEDERFWVAACVTTLVGARLANHIGLTSFDIEGLKAFLVQSFLTLRGKRDNCSNDLAKPDNIFAILGDFLADKLFQYTIYTNVLWQSQGRPPVGYITLEGENTSRVNRLNAVHVHISRDGFIRMAKTPLNTWLNKRGIHPTDYIDALKRVATVIESKGKLGGGTSMADDAGRDYIQIHYSGTPLENTVAEHEEERKNG